MRTGRSGRRLRQAPHVHSPRISGRPLCPQVFLVDVRAGKREIKAAVQRMYDFKTSKINSLIR